MPYNEAMYDQVLYGSGQTEESLSGFFEVKIYRVPPKDLKLPFGIASVEPVLTYTKDNYTTGKARWRVYFYVGSLKEAKELIDKAYMLPLRDFFKDRWQVYQTNTALSEISDKVYEVRVEYLTAVRT